MKKELVEYGVELLNTINDFNMLSDKEICQLLEIASWRNYQPNEIIFSESQPAESIFILDKGNVTLTISGWKTLFVNHGEIFGELAIINNTYRLGTAISKDNSRIIEIDSKLLFDVERIAPSIALKIIKAIARKYSILSQSKSQLSTTILLETGESSSIEFKSTLRKNLRSNKNDENIELAVIKTIAAFLNTSGGTLLVGVDDDGNILGLKDDGFVNDDKLLLHVVNIIKDRIGNIVLSNIHYELIEINSKKILRVDCKPVSEPAFAKCKSDECFYIRSGPSTISLSFSQFIKYYKKRF